VHHVTRWIDGGRTVIDELVLLCDRHHHVIHLPGWILKFDGHELSVFRPDGRELREVTRGGQPCPT
jgi:hypothetical protein